MSCTDNSCVWHYDSTFVTDTTITVGYKINFTEKSCIKYSFFDEFNSLCAVGVDDVKQDPAIDSIWGDTVITPTENLLMHVIWSAQAPLTYSPSIFLRGRKVNQPETTFACTASISLATSALDSFKDYNRDSLRMCLAGAWKWLTVCQGTISCSWFDPGDYNYNAYLEFEGDSFFVYKDDSLLKSGLLTMRDQWQYGMQLVLPASSVALADPYRYDLLNEINACSMIFMDSILELRSGYAPSLVYYVRDTSFSNKTVKTRHKNVSRESNHPSAIDIKHTMDRVIISVNQKINRKVLIDVYTISGKRVSRLSNNELKATNKTLTMDLSSLSAGTYLMLITIEKKSEIHKIIISR